MKLPRLKNNILRDPAGVARELTRGICVLAGEATADMRYVLLMAHGRSAKIDRRKSNRDRPHGIPLKKRSTLG